MIQTLLHYTTLLTISMTNFTNVTTPLVNLVKWWRHG